MHSTLVALVLSLPLTALAGMPHEGSIRRRHADVSRSYSRRGAVYQLEDMYQGSSFFKYVMIASSALLPSSVNADRVARSFLQWLGLFHR